MTENRQMRRAPLLIAVGAAAAAVAVLGELAESVRDNNTLVRVDERVVDAIVMHRSGRLTGVARTVTTLGDLGFVSVLVAVATVVLLATHHRRHALLLFASSAGAAIFVTLAKHVVDRPRPPDVDRLVASDGYAFPSGHAAQGVACYLALAFIAGTLITDSRKRTIIFAIAGLTAFAIGLSRVYLGVHWPSDVVSGWLLAAGWLTALVGMWYSLPRSGDRLIEHGRGVAH